MKTTTDNCFSNGTEWMMWVERNCDRCWKQSVPKGNDEYTKYVCSINAQIDGQVAGLYEINQRTYDIAQMKDCPYRQEKRQQYKSKKKQSNEQSLF